MNLYFEILFNTELSIRRAMVTARAITRATTRSRAVAEIMGMAVVLMVIFKKYT